MYQVLETEEYVLWFKDQTKKDQGQIQARIALIRIQGHFGKVKKLNANLAELKWKSGRRIYFTTFREDDGSVILLLLGGNKNGQDKDIRKAKSLINKLQETEE